MARKKKQEEAQEIKDDLDALTKELIDGINSDHKDKIAFNLESDDAPTNIPYYIDSGSRLLNFVLAGNLNFGMPAGRIIEVYGPPSIGKSHLAIQICKNAQKMGGLCIYADCENGTSKTNLELLGVNLKRLIYVQPSCVEDVFTTAERTITRAKEMNKDIPIVFIWDSIAASAPKDEIEGNYENHTIGLKARVLSRGMRKITNMIGNNKVTFLMLNQTRQKIGVMFGNPTTTPGGMAVPFHSSVRIELNSNGKLKDKNDEIYGIGVKAKAIKNKIIAPFKSCEFEIHFGVGIKEHNQIFDLIKKQKDNTVKFNDIEVVVKDGAWKGLTIKKGEEVIYDNNFRKDELEDVLKQNKKYIDLCLEKLLYGKVNPDIDLNNFEERKSLEELL